MWRGFRSRAREGSETDLALGVRARVDDAVHLGEREARARGLVSTASVRLALREPSAKPRRMEAGEQPASSSAGRPTLELAARRALTSPLSPPPNPRASKKRGTHVEVQVVVLLAVGVLARDVDGDDDVVLALDARRHALRVVLEHARNDLGVLPGGQGGVEAGASVAGSGGSRWGRQGRRVAEAQGWRAASDGLSSRKGEGGEGGTHLDSHRKRAGTPWRSAGARRGARQLEDKQKQQAG